MSNTPTPNPADRWAVPPFDRGNLIVALVSAVIVIVASVGGSLLVWSMRDQLPEVVAIHWGADGRADGFQRLSETYVTNAGMIATISLFLVVLGGVMKQARFIGPVAAGTAVFMAVLMYGSIISQRGLTGDEVRRSFSGSEMLLGLVLGIGVGAGLGFAFRKRRVPGEQPVAVQVGADSPRLLVEDDVTLAWTGRTNVPRVVWIILGASAVVTLIPAVISALAGSWQMVLTMVVLAALTMGIGASMAADVTIDARGVRVRGLGFIPWITVPLDRIAGASVTKVSPMGEFGGWGLRVGFNGDKGFVTANGPAIRINQGSDPDVLITIADAEAAAAVINTLVSRRAGGPDAQ